MNYCTLDQVLAVTGNGTNPTPRPIPAPYEDTVVNEAIAAASRAIDKEVTGSDLATDYFLSETLTLQETGPAIVDRNGDLHAWLRKPYISSITTLQYRHRGDQDWTTAEAGKITISGQKVIYWSGDLEAGAVMARATYAGGLATAPASLPGDLQRAAIVLAARYWNEGKAGLTDTIGVAELGTLQYTRAIPLEVLRLLSPYCRPVPW